MPNLLPQPQSTTLSLDAKIRKTSFHLSNMAKSQYRSLCSMQKDGIRLMWDNPDGLTPQQVADIAGENGGKLMSFHAGLTNFIVAAATADGVAPDIALPTHNFTVGEDGRVTVLNTPYTPA